MAAEIGRPAAGPRALDRASMRPRRMAAEIPGSLSADPAGVILLQ